MSGDQAKFFGEGMVITRMSKSGEIEKLETLKPGMMKRIEMIGKLNDRRLKYMVAGDRASLLKLAAEYEQKHMSTMAGVVRKEADETHSATVSSKHRRTIQSDGTTNDQVVQRKRKADDGAQGHSHRPHGAGRIVQADVSRGGTSRKREKNSQEVLR